MRGATTHRRVFSGCAAARTTVSNIRPGFGHIPLGKFMFVFTGGGVWSPTVAELDFAFIEVLFEFGPFGGGRGPVCPGRPAAGEVGLEWRMTSSWKTVT